MNEPVLPSLLQEHALAIWQAGVEAVHPRRLLPQVVSLRGRVLRVGALRFPLEELGRLIVVGGGKASAAMAAALEGLLPEELLERTTGWVNVPQDCLLPTRAVHLHPARPPGVNEPTPQAAQGTQRILELVASAGEEDLVLVLLSGGASALLPAPVPDISLEDKLAVTRFLSAAGANIRQLNTVRKALSRIKGGGLLRACRAGWLVGLVLSDVLGDPLDVIGSGPTVPESPSPQEALDVLRQFDPEEKHLPPAIWHYLRQQAQQPREEQEPACRWRNMIVGNNATAVDAAGQKALELGYRPVMQSARQLEGAAEELGRHLASVALTMAQDDAAPDCLVSGGEPTVTLPPPEVRGRGGRNQQLVLAALEHFQQKKADLAGVLLLSGGTDGEDGPTDAAGAWVDARVMQRARDLGLDAADYLRRCDAYTFFEQTGSLLKTGPTQTNVCDLRVVLVQREQRG